MNKVLLVEDSAECQLVVARALVNSDIHLTTVGSVSEGLQLIRSGLKPDLLILDLNLPDGDGLGILDQLRSSAVGPSTAVFCLTSENQLDTKVTAFNLGADDYLVKPVSPVELRARILARLRKLDHSRPLDVINLDELTVDIGNMKASLSNPNGTEFLDLTTKEFKILSYLIKNQNKVFSRQTIMTSIWGSDVHLSSRTIDSHICSLRKKLKSAARYIQNVPGAGYRFSSSVTDSDMPQS